METKLGGGVSVISNVLSSSVRNQVIKRGYELGFESAPVQGISGEALAALVRSNTRVVFDDEILAAIVFEQVKNYLPDATRLNSRCRIYRYAHGQQFDWHVDDCYEEEHEISKLTLLVYLNSDYKGGSTDFAWESIRVKAGDALVFPHHLRHRGAPVTAGVKYVLRTDVMYQKT